MKTNPALPPHFTFDLALAKHGWPLVTRDGQKAEILKFDTKNQKPLVGIISESDSEFVCAWDTEGVNFSAGKTNNDLFLSADTSNPALRAAVEAAHKAGEEISAIWGDSKTLAYRGSKGPSWDLENFTYLPTRLLSQLPKPEPAWTLPEPPPGQQWHRKDGWTREMLPEGWRPLLFNEERQNGDQIWESHWVNYSRHSSFDVRATSASMHTRTRRPLPSPPALWSCPADLGFPWPLMKHRQRPIVCTITQVDDTGISVYGWSAKVLWSELADWLHSRDGLNFHPCTK